MNRLHWWEETEARALRIRGAAQLALTIWQRLREAGMAADLSLLPAHGLARAYMLGCDLVQLIDSLLVAPQGTARLHLTELVAWCRQGHWTLEESARPFGLLLDSLRLDRAEEENDYEDGPAVGGPAEQAKQDGRYRHWHLLYERLDLKLEAEGLPAGLRVPVARELAEVYEEFLVLVRDLTRLIPDTPARWGRWSRLVADFDATFHYHVGPRRLAPARITGSAAELGLQNRLLACLAPAAP